MLNAKSSLRFEPCFYSNLKWKSTDLAVQEISALDSVFHTRFVRLGRSLEFVGFLDFSLSLTARLNTQPIDVPTLLIAGGWIVWCHGTMV